MAEGSSIRAEPVSLAMALHAFERLAAMPSVDPARGQPKFWPCHPSSLARPLDVCDVRRRLFPADVDVCHRKAVVAVMAAALEKSDEAVALDACCSKSGKSEKSDEAAALSAGHLLAPAVHCGQASSWPEVVAFLPTA